MSSGNRFCVKCGTALPENATFCPSCGTPVSPGAPQQGTSVPPRWERRYDRHEKGEKHEKNEKNEKNEKGRGGDITGAITGALILIWLGISFYLAQSGRVAWENWWQLFLIGIGAVLILQGILMYARSRRPFIGPIIGGVILILIGSSFLAGTNWGDYWPLIFVAIGVLVLVSALAGRRRVPNP